VKTNPPKIYKQLIAMTCFLKNFFRTDSLVHIIGYCAAAHSKTTYGLPLDAAQTVSDSEHVNAA